MGRAEKEGEGGGGRFACVPARSMMGSVGFGFILVAEWIFGFGLA